MTTAAVRRLSVPSPDELIERARAMVPEIRAMAEETERNRTLLPHHVSLNWDAVGTMYGQHLFGLEPKGQY